MSSAIQTWSDEKIKWERFAIPPDKLREFTKRSDSKGLAQSLGFLLLLCGTGAISYYMYLSRNWVLMAIALYLHGTFFSFMPGLAVHELTHNTVFRSAWLNWLITHIYGVFAWVMNPYAYRLSHRRHHYYTLHKAQEGEEPVSRRFSWKDPSLILSYFKVIYIRYFLIHMSRLLTFRPQGVGCSGPQLSAWENFVLKEKSKPGEWRAVKSWAVFCFFAHLIFAIWAIWSGHWFLVVLVTLAPFYGGYWYVSLVGTHMHTAVEDNTNDFRKCCHSMKLDPFSSFLYWHMEFHIEHHMYAAVPCYNLKKFSKYLHENFEMPEAKGLLAILNYCDVQADANPNAGPRFQLP